MSSRPTALRRLEQAWFEAPIEDFIGMSEAEIIGQLTIKSFHSVDNPQTKAWRVEIGVLKQVLTGFTGHVLLEFDIPRMGRRIDAVTIVGAVLLLSSLRLVRIHLIGPPWSKSGTTHST